MSAFVSRSLGDESLLLGGLEEYHPQVEFQVYHFQRVTNLTKGP